MPVCNSCSTWNPDGAANCASCGAPLALQQTPPAVPGYGQQPFGAAPPYGAPPPLARTVSYDLIEAQKEARKALIASIVGLFCFGFILGILAIKWSQSAKRAFDAAGSNDGRGLANAAMVIGVIDIVFWVIAIALRIAGS